jgi:4-hydroxyacetophenone monooxygenase
MAVESRDGGDEMTPAADGRAQAALGADALREALHDADLRVLLMVLFHLTGERRWLEDPFRPRRDVRLIADESAGLGPEAQRAIRSAAFELLSHGVPAPAVASPDEATLLEMMSACLGEPVESEYAPLMREDMGFVSGDAQWRTKPSPQALADAQVLIVGAGVSGLGLAMQLKELGIPFTIVERNDEVGGTWLENRYPGAGVDTPNLFYSWSSHRNTGWTRYFSLRDEILAYLRDSATSLGLRPHIRLRTELERADWDEARNRWRVELSRRPAADASAGAGGAGACGTAPGAAGEPADGGVEVLEPRFLVSAIGHVSEPNDTRFSGMETFAGPIFHSARWPEGLDLKGKRVAVVGTGATAMQLAPTVAPEVASLTIYQRTPQWARPTPEYHREVSPGARWLFEHVPFYAQWFRFTLFWRYGDGLLRFLRRDPAWPYPERAMNRVNDRHREQMAEHIQRSLASRPELVERCLPTYPPYAKRILLDNGWFEMLLRENVELVTDDVARLDAGGIVAADGTRREHDVVVLATGFSIARLAARLDIRGAGGRTLAQAWADDNPTAYLGMTVPGFPNLFVLYGPNTNLAHGGSVFFHGECQARYVAKTLVELLERGASAIDVRQEAHDAWVAKVDAEHAQLVWTHPGTGNWYRNRHGRVVSVSPFRLVDYWRMTHEADLGSYRVTG